MIKEFIISIYLFFFRILFLIFSIIPLKSKTTFIVSFNGNLTSTINTHKAKLTKQKLITLKSHSCTEFFQNSDKDLYFSIKKPTQFIQAIYHIATSTHIIIDNYHAFLAAVKFKNEVLCTQVWHAAGAIKKFGLEDKSNVSRNPRAIKRFRSVYNQFNWITVGSDAMANIFKKSFGVNDAHFLYTGVPRTDFFFDEFSMEQTKKSIKRNFPKIDGRKVILYAPTYRDNEIDSATIQLDINKMSNLLQKEYILLLRLHPVVSNNLNIKENDFIYNVSNYDSINELLVCADILITDYSSIPFEYALLNKPIIFYLYDYEDYDKSRGIIKEVVHKLPGPISYTTEQVIDIIENKQYQLDKLKEFNYEWNKYSNGHSSNALIHELFHNKF